MIPKSQKTAVSLILCALLLSACALRPTEHAVPDDPAAETVSTPAEADAEPDDPASETDAAENAETEKPEMERDETAQSETETVRPETEKPETEVRETEAPETEKPETERPETEARETEPAETEAPLPPAPGDGGSVDGDEWRDSGLNLRFVLPGEDWRYEGGTDPAPEEASEENRYVLRAASEAGSTVLFMERRIPLPEDGGERVTLGEYVGILTESMLANGGADVTVKAGEPGEAELAGKTWTRTAFTLTWPGDAESRSLWYAREEDGWFLTLAVTASPADWLDAEGILAMLTAAGDPVPEKPIRPGEPVPPAQFAWGSDSLEGNVYRCPFAGISVTAAQGWHFLTQWELADRNGLYVSAGKSIAEVADEENVRCVMRLENDAGASMELSFIRSGVFGDGGWEQYAAYLTDSLMSSGEKAGFAMSATEGEWAVMAGENWYVRIVTYSAGGYPVGQRMLLWRPVEGELAELTLDNGVWTDIPLSDMLGMVGTAE